MFFSVLLGRVRRLLLAGVYLGGLVVTALGINLDIAEPWVMGIILGGLGVFLTCVITSSLLHQE